MSGLVGAAPPEERIALTIDRPFLFAIVDKWSGAILFLGRVMCPDEGGSRR